MEIPTEVSEIDIRVCMNNVRQDIYELKQLKLNGMVRKELGKLNIYKRLLEKELIKLNECEDGFDF